jgi:hypothetical protein
MSTWAGTSFAGCKERFKFMKELEMDPVHSGKTFCPLKKFVI